VSNRSLANRLCFRTYALLMREWWRALRRQLNSPQPHRLSGCLCESRTLHLGTARAALVYDNSPSRGGPLSSQTALADPGGATRVDSTFVSDTRCHRPSR
jgi:hypothetical protein